MEDDRHPAGFWPMQMPKLDRDAFSTGDGLRGPEATWGTKAPADFSAFRFCPDWSWRCQEHARENEPAQSQVQDDQYGGDRESDRKQDTFHSHGYVVCWVACIFRFTLIITLGI
jgi:hypothetical protein